MGAYSPYTEADTPTRYDLAVDQFTLKITIHPAFFKEFQKQSSNFVNNIAPGKTLSLPVFIDPTNSPWGFGGCATTTMNEKGWYVISVLAPREPEHGFAVSATLQALFHFIYIVTVEKAESPTKQLAMIWDMRTFAGMSGGYFDVEITPQFVAWLRSRTGATEIEEVMETMHLLATWVSPDNMLTQEELIDPLYRREGPIIGCDCFIRKSHWVFIGEGIHRGLGPFQVTDEFNFRHGYVLDPNNIDDPLSQFIMIAAVAKLCEIARREGF